MHKFMAAFERILINDADADRKLGNRNIGDADRRREFYATVTGGAGFRQPPKEPRSDWNGQTRRERKQRLRETYLAECRKPQADKWKHSSRKGARVNECGPMG